MTMQRIKIDQNIDLRGVSCPVYFLKTKLKLKEMQDGQILEILLDDGEPIANVPRSAKEEGHKILEINQVGNYFKVLIRKASAADSG